MSAPICCSKRLLSDFPDEYDRLPSKPARRSESAAMAELKEMNDFGHLDLSIDAPVTRPSAADIPMAAIVRIGRPAASLSARRAIAARHRFVRRCILFKTTQFICIFAMAVLPCARQLPPRTSSSERDSPDTTGEPFKLTIGGFRHAGEPWQFPDVSTTAPAGHWSPWVDVSKWPWHGKVDREGGIAEWPSMTIHVQRTEPDGAKGGRAIEVELADAPAEGRVVHHFTEKSESNAIGFLVPHPLREHAREFETGSQMAARHLAWARQATGGAAIHLRQFTFCTSLWGPYDPALARREIDALRQLGFNVIGGTDPELIARAGGSHGPPERLVQRRPGEIGSGLERRRRPAGRQRVEDPGRPHGTGRGGVLGAG